MKIRRRNQALAPKSVALRVCTGTRAPTAPLTAILSARIRCRHRTAPRARNSLTAEPMATDTVLLRVKYILDVPPAARKLSQISTITTQTSTTVTRRMTMICGSSHDVQLPSDALFLGKSAAILGFRTDGVGSLIRLPMELLLATPCTHSFFPQRTPQRLSMRAMGFASLKTPTTTFYASRPARRARDDSLSLLLLRLSGGWRGGCAAMCTIASALDYDC